MRDSPAQELDVLEQRCLVELDVSLGLAPPGAVALSEEDCKLFGITAGWRVPVEGQEGVWQAVSCGVKRELPANVRSIRAKPGLLYDPSSFYDPQSKMFCRPPVYTDRPSSQCSRPSIWQKASVFMSKHGTAVFITTVAGCTICGCVYILMLTAHSLNARQQTRITATEQCEIYQTGRGVDVVTAHTACTDGHGWEVFKK